MSLSSWLEGMKHISGNLFKLFAISRVAPVRRPTAICTLLVTPAVDSRAVGGAIVKPPAFRVSVVAQISSNATRGSTTAATVHGERAFQIE